MGKTEAVQGAQAPAGRRVRLKAALGALQVRFADLQRLAAALDAL
ncbi:hypothetical protein RB620_27615 [Paenibacillus sp. LHD-117]|nr:hypothetical protein [Paenibacillus sp. LHD-117]MDQ6423202.1 hypothetical protein [Paenibacillus sp. LHD-117]